MDDEEKIDEPFKDGALEILVRLLNTVEDDTDGRVTEGVTLCVKGLLISGIVISRKEFFRSHSMLEYIDETLDKLASEGEIPKPNKSDPIYFIHLKNAHVFGAGNSRIPSDEAGTFWRGRLDAIDGFFVGQLKGPPSA